MILENYRVGEGAEYVIYFKVRHRDTKWIFSYFVFFLLIFHTNIGIREKIIVEKFCNDDQNTAALDVSSLL